MKKMTGLNVILSMMLAVVLAACGTAESQQDSGQVSTTANLEITSGAEDKLASEDTSADVSVSASQKEEVPLGTRDEAAERQRAEGWRAAGTEAYNRLLSEWERYPGCGSEEAAIRQAILMNWCGDKYKPKDQMYMFFPLDPADYLVESDLENGYLELMFQIVPDKGITQDIIYRVDKENKLIWRIGARQSNGMASGSFTPINGEPFSYEPYLSDQPDLAAEAEEIYSLVDRVLQTRFNVALNRNDTMVYTSGIAGMGVGRGEYFWVIDTVINGNFYQFGVYYDREQNKLYGSCKDSLIVNGTEGFVTPGHFFDGMLLEGGDLEMQF